MVVTRYPYLSLQATPLFLTVVTKKILCEKSNLTLEYVNKFKVEIFRKVKSIYELLLF